MQQNRMPIDGHRVSRKYVESLIGTTQYHNFEGTSVTVCCLTLVNGFTVTGESICGMGQEFDEEQGQQVAYAKALEKIYPLESYVRRRAFHTLGLTNTDNVSPITQ